MHSSIVFLPAFLAIAMASPQSSGTLGLGAVCSSTSDCANGAQCYASNSMLVLHCGNTGATCSSDSQCAYNTCTSGSCSGVLPSSATSLPSSTAIVASTTTASPTATATSLALGAVCSSTSQCANGAECYAVNSMLQTHCGNTGATCSSDSQCAFNTCTSGSCQGVLSSSSSSFGATTASSVQSSSFTTSISTTASAEKHNTTLTLTSTGVPAGYTTSVTVVNGVTSSVLINSAGATTSFGAVATSVTTTTKAGGAGKLGAGFGGILAVVGAVAMLF